MDEYAILQPCRVDRRKNVAAKIRVLPEVSLDHRILLRHSSCQRLGCQAGNASEQRKVRGEMAVDKGKPTSGLRYGKPRDIRLLQRRATIGVSEAGLV